MSVLCKCNERHLERKKISSKNRRTSSLWGLNFGPRRLCQQKTREKLVLIKISTIANLSHWMHKPDVFDEKAVERERTLALAMTHCFKEISI